MSKLYGVFVGSKWGMTWNKRTAMRVAKKEGGEVRSLTDRAETSYWDLPTFYVLSEPVADFRQTLKA